MFVEPKKQVFLKILLNSKFYFIFVIRNLVYIMKKYILLLAMLSFLANAKTKDTIKTENININFPESINVHQIPTKDDSDHLYNAKNMPWIVAFAVGFLTIAINYYISHLLRKSNERIFKQQLDANKEIKALEIKSSIGTKNRQEWLNNLTETLSEYLSSVSLVTYGIENEEFKQLIYRASLSKAKLELLLSNEKKEQNELYLSIQTIYSIMLRKDDSDMIENNCKKYISEMTYARHIVIKKARDLFEVHWQKIKNPK